MDTYTYSIPVQIWTTRLIMEIIEFYNQDNRDKVDESIIKIIDSV